MTGECLVPYLPSLKTKHKGKQVIDNASKDEDFFIRDIAAPMKQKFDKYWGQCNLLMSIASVLDPRCKFRIIGICFHLLYKPKEIAKENMENV